jgi:GTP-binding protein Era
VARAPRTDPHRAGTAALVGRPNVGKSTLLNAAVGQDLAIVSAVPQTTRNRILGVVVRPGMEVALLDTPGIHKPLSGLGRALNRTARSTALEADVVLYVTAPGPRGLVHPGDRTLLADIGAGRPTVLVVNQVDRVHPKERLLPLLEELMTLREFAAVVPISALRRDGVELVLEEVQKLLPLAPPRFEADTLTDRPVRFFAGEFVRGAILGATREEIPHAVAVEIQSFEEREKLVRIEATVHVEREGQKAILIGKRGEKLKSIGQEARLRIEEFLETKVYLALWVRVTPGWTNSERNLSELGYSGEP